MKIIFKLINLSHYIKFFCARLFMKNTFAADPEWRLEGKLGLFTILHTWSQTLTDHFHIHCLIPAGVLSMDGKRWVASKDDFLFHVVPLAKEFKKRNLSLKTSRLHTLTIVFDSFGFCQPKTLYAFDVYTVDPGCYKLTPKRLGRPSLYKPAAQLKIHLTFIPLRLHQGR